MERGVDGGTPSRVAISPAGRPDGATLSSNAKELEPRLLGQGTKRGRRVRGFSRASENLRNIIRAQAQRIPYQRIRR